MVEGEERAKGSRREGEGRKERKTGHTWMMGGRKGMKGNA